MANSVVVESWDLGIPAAFASDLANAAG